MLVNEPCAEAHAHTCASREKCLHFLIQGLVPHCVLQLVTDLFTILQSLLPAELHKGVLVAQGLLLGSRLLHCFLVTLRSLWPLS